ncbi:MAG: hypothetical protein DYG87_01270 [Anaerolineae bacterium CFX3]|nr:hypothetical protein [Anaerolineae bacterium CFX3]MCQ3946226.1 hypothetical protein [Anaerolineae bacterium]
MKGVCMEYLFAGREKELQKMELFYRAIENQTPHTSNLLILEGEAGSGKSSLIKHFTNTLKTLHHPQPLIGVVSCELFSRESSFLPFFQLLDIYRSQGGFLSRISNLEQFNRVVGEVAPAWLKMLPIVGNAVAETVATIRNNQENRYKQNNFAPSQLLDTDVYNQFLKLLRKISEGNPVVLVIDDLQWADDETGHLFSYIARKLPETNNKIALIGAYRSYDMKSDNKNLLDTFTDLEKRKEAITLKIPPFTVEDISSLLETLYKTNSTEISSEFRTKLISHTNGNPLFITEILKHLEEEHKIILVGDNNWQFKSTNDILSDLPDSLHAVLEQRIEKLEKRLKELLTLASVEGGSFTAEILAKIKNIELAEVLNTLVEDLSKNYRLVNEGSEIEISLNTFASLYEFRHGLIRDYIYNNLSQTQKRILHQQVGNCLESLYGRKYFLIANQLANHFLIAKDYQKLARYGLIVARQEMEKFSPRQAIWWANTVLDALRRLDESNNTVRGETLLILIQANIHLGNHNDALSKINEMELIEDLDEVQKGFCKYLKSNVTVGETQDDPLELLLPALEVFRIHNEIQLVSWTLRRLAHIFATRGKFEDSEKYSSECINLLESLQDSASLETLGMIWSDVAEYAIAAGDMRKAEEANQKALNIFQQIKNKKGVAVMLGNLGGLEYMYGNLAKSETLTRRSVELFREMEDVGKIIEGSDNLARVLIIRGKVAEAKRLLLDIEPIALQMNDVGFLPEIYIHLSQVATLEKDAEQAAIYGIKSTRIVTSDDQYSAPRAFCTAALCLLDVGKVDQANHYMDHAIKMVNDTSFTFLYVKALVYFDYAQFLSRTTNQIKQILQISNEAGQIFLQLNARRDFEKVNDFEKSLKGKI